MNYNENPEVHSSQVSKVLAYMRAGHRITPLEALDLFGAMRLSAIIKDIEEIIGFPPHRQFVAVKNRFGKDVRVMQYWLNPNE